MIKEKTVCLTGYRSQKLPWGFNEKDPRCIDMRMRTKEKFEESINEGYEYFISGMALGFDMICAEIVLELKEEYPHIKLVGAIPCKNQDRFWMESDRKRYKELLKRADIVVLISESYTEDCMLKRNVYMLEHSSRVIALYDGKAGGTKHTISKAKNMGLDIILITPLGI